jgi:NitT/TauT family transport system substrate-binding protein
VGITRRNFITQLTVGLAGVPWVRWDSWAQGKLKLGYMKIVDNAAMFVAMEQGFFKAEGLALETLPMAGGALVVPGVTSGNLQIGFTNVISLYQAHVEGFDCKLIASGATYVKGPREVHALQVLITSPIKDARDLEGKTVAVNTLNNITHLMDMAWIDKQGASSSKVRFVEVPFPQMEAALIGGKIDAISVAEPFATAAVEKGRTRLLAHAWGDVLPRFLIAGWFASETWIAKHKDLAQAFVRAISRGVEAIHADPEGGRAALVKWTGLDPDMAGKIVWPVFETGISEQDLQTTIDLTQRYRLISRSIAARDVISDLALKD